MAPLEPLNVVGSEMAGLNSVVPICGRKVNEEIEVFRSGNFHGKLVLAP